MPHPLKSIFFGTDDVAVLVLDELRAAGHEPVLIITAPDAPRGRKLVLTPPPVKEWAIEYGVDVLQPPTLTDKDLPDELRNTDWDLFLVASYGALIPQALLDIPKHGTLNMHPSLLPKFRGPSPIQSAILADEQETGVSVMLLDETMDHGPIIAQASITPDPWPPKEPVLRELLAREGGKLLAEVIPEWIAGTITPEAQDDTKATYTKKFTKEDGLIDLSADPRTNFLKIRALSDNPGTYFFADRNGKKIRVKIVDAEYEDGELHLTRVIPEGKKEMSYQDFLNGGH